MDHILPRKFCIREKIVTKTQLVQQETLAGVVDNLSTKAEASPLEVCVTGALPDAVSETEAAVVVPVQTAVHETAKEEPATAQEPEATAASEAIQETAPEESVTVPQEPQATTITEAIQETGAVAVPQEPDATAVPEAIQETVPEESVAEETKAIQETVPEESVAEETKAIQETVPEESMAVADEPQAPAKEESAEKEPAVSVVPENSPGEEKEPTTLQTREDILAAAMLRSQRLTPIHMNKLLLKDLQFVADHFKVDTEGKKNTIIANILAYFKTQKCV